MKRRKFPFAAALALTLLAISSVFQSLLSPVAAARGYVGSSGRPSASAVAHAAGEFRIAAANIIWLQVIDRYTHQYMKQGGRWAKDTSLLPYLRMITCLDPHFTEAYDVGGLILADTGRYDAADKFLKEGIANNPNSWLLNYDIAMNHAWYQKDYRTALVYAERARDLADDPFYKHRMAMFCNTLVRDTQVASAG